MAHYFQPTNFRPRPRQARKPGVLRVSPLLHDFPFSVPSYGARNMVHGPRSFSQFPFSFFQFPPFPVFRYTLPSSVSRNSFVCHSYENCRGGYPKFPKRKRRLLTACCGRGKGGAERLQFEALKGDRRGQYSIRINDQWRICFDWPERSPGPANVEIVDYH